MHLSLSSPPPTPASLLAEMPQPRKSSLRQATAAYLTQKATESLKTQAPALSISDSLCWPQNCRCLPIIQRGRLRPARAKDLSEAPQETK